MDYFIELTQGKHTLVDYDDYVKFNVYKWHTSHNGLGKDLHYACRNEKVNGKIVYKALHREIMNVSDNRIVDHINGNTLDNRKENLRICSKKENSYNQTKSKNNKSGYKGVVEYSDNKDKIPYYKVFITVDRKQMYLGSSKSKICAALIYDEFSLCVHGKYAKLNFPLYNSSINKNFDINKVNIFKILY